MARVGEIAKISPDTIEGYQTLSDSGRKTSRLGPKIRELISDASVSGSAAISIQSGFDAVD